MSDESKAPDKTPAQGPASPPLQNDEMAAALEAAMEAVEAVKSRKQDASEPTPAPLPETATLPGTPSQAEAAAKAAPAAAAGDEDALAAARKEAEDWKARTYRAVADLENARRRFTREKEELRKFAIEGIIKEILPVVDNLERAVSHAPDAEDPLTQGVRMVLRQFTTVVGNQGAKPFDAVGEPFDPTLHEAMTQMPTNEVPPGHVAQVFQRGWMLHDRLVRPAMVVVAAAPEGEDLDDSIEDEQTPVPIDEDTTQVPEE